MFWWRLRTTRAHPPGRASAEKRSATYSGALEQCEQLVRAAAGVGAEARPLLLFYGLSQAGRAIAAVHLENDWEFRSHGLSMAGPDSPRSLLYRRVRPSGNGGAFQRVAVAIGSEALSEPAALGALWAALPDLAVPPLPERDAAWRVPLRLRSLDPDIPGVSFVMSNLVEAAVHGLSDASDPDRMAAELNEYPTAKGGEVMTVADGTPVFVDGGELGLLPRVMWRAEGTSAHDREARLETIAPIYRTREDRYSLPRVGPDHLHPLLLWWALLFALSSLGRYEPGLWSRALEVDESPLAVPLEAALAEAIVAIPQLVYSAIVGKTVLADAPW